MLAVVQILKYALAEPTSSKMEKFREDLARDGRRPACAYSAAVVCVHARPCSANTYQPSNSDEGSQSLLEMMSCHLRPQLTFASHHSVIMVGHRSRENLACIRGLTLMRIPPAFPLPLFQISASWQSR